jgi:hypothetical protein
MAGISTLADPPVVPIPLCHHQVQRIAASSVFRNAPTLQMLFRFLATKVLEERSDDIKEYTIGVEALARRPDFDPKTDPIVRVQVYRLRQKLKEYYDAEGAHDSVFVEIPKGHYLPRFEVLTSLPASLHPLPAPEPGTKVITEATSKKRYVEFSATVLVIGIALIVLAYVAGFSTEKYRHRGQQDAPALASQWSAVASTDPVKAFWSPLLQEDSSPIIAYADAIFLLDGSSDLFRFRHGASDNRGAPVDLHLARQYASNSALVAKAGPLYYDNGYTGTGELQAVAILTSLFTQMGATPIVESSYDITTEDLKQHNVILLGSPFQNVAVEQLPVIGDFRFIDPASVHDLWSGWIVNSRPQANEKPIYRTERDPSTQILKADYALISFEPGVVPGRHIVNMGGLDTTGTQGAVMLATSKSGVEELGKGLSSVNRPNRRGSVPVFQALLKVDLAKGYQVLDTRLLAVHSLQSDAAAPGKRPSSP